MTTSRDVTLTDVSPRDGLQIEAVVLSVGQKVELVNRLSAAGIPAIEVGSFVSPQAVPQMAGTDEVFAKIDLLSSTTYHALVPNRRGYDDAKDAGVKSIRLVVGASEPLHQANFRRSIRESLDAQTSVIEAASREGVAVEAIIAGALGDPYVGPTPIGGVLNVIRHYYEHGVRTMTVADTVGMGTPGQVRELIKAVRSGYPDVVLGAHFHDTRGTGLANVLAALELGIAHFDAAVGGTGGCPFAPKAGGNICFEDLLHMLEGMGVSTGVNLDAVIRTAQWLEGVLGRELPGKLLKADPVYPSFRPAELPAT